MSDDNESELGDPCCNIRIFDRGPCECCSVYCIILPILFCLLPVGIICSVCETCSCEETKNDYIPGAKQLLCCE